MTRRPALLGLLLAACGPTEEPVDTGERAPRAWPTDWAGVEGFFGAHCVSCHRVGGQAEFLPLPGGLALDLLGGEGPLVVPGAPESSRIWTVLREGFMPLNAGGLPPSERNHVRDWIAAGAEHPYAGVDLDGDGFTTEEGDCDESSAAVRPSAMEVCGDGLDNDCSGTADGPDAVDAATWYADGDGDGYGAVEGSEVVACESPAGHAAEAGDCADTDPEVHPGQSETVDGLDQDCDGFVDEQTSHALDLEPLYASYCSCHVSGAAPVLDLWTVDAYANLVGVPSTQLPTMDLIEPGDPATSYLWHKVQGTHLDVGGSGVQMPRNAPPLDPGTLALIEAWILEGAPP